MKWVKPVGFRGHGLSDSLWMSPLMMLGINKSLLFTIYTKWEAVESPVRMIGKGFEWRLAGYKRMSGWGKKILKEGSKVRV